VYSRDSRETLVLKKTATGDEERGTKFGELSRLKEAPHCVKILGVWEGPRMIPRGKNFL